MNAWHLSIDELADALEEASGGLSPHRFSQGWDCARKVTGGRITGLASSTVDGTPALLVYMKSEDSTQVTVATGCRVSMPSAGPSAVLPG
jgi:predicted RNA-binding protein associated with RNAse of E/G family